MGADHFLDTVAMTAKPKLADDDRETERRRDEALRRALAMPPKKRAVRAPDVHAGLMKCGLSSALCGIKPPL
jgi:hypothetical protein